MEHSNKLTQSSTAIPTEDLMKLKDKYGQYFYECVDKQFRSIEKREEDIFREDKIHLIINLYVGKLSKEPIKDYYLTMKEFHLDSIVSYYEEYIGMVMKNDKKQFGIYSTFTFVTQSSIPADFKYLWFSKSKFRDLSKKNSIDMKWLNLLPTFIETRPYRLKTIYKEKLEENKKVDRRKVVSSYFKSKSIEVQDELKSYVTKLLHTSQYLEKEFTKQREEIHENKIITACPKNHALRKKLKNRLKFTGNPVQIEQNIEWKLIDSVEHNVADVITEQLCMGDAEQKLSFENPFRPVSSDKANQESLKIDDNESSYRKARSFSRISNTISHRLKKVINKNEHSNGELNTIMYDEEAVNREALGNKKNNSSGKWNMLLNRVKNQKGKK